jgi:hypothetical protein
MKKWRPWPPRRDNIRGRKSLGAEARDLPSTGKVLAAEVNPGKVTVRPKKFHRRGSKGLVRGST